jgi:hypothetical protein
VGLSTGGVVVFFCSVDEVEEAGGFVSAGRSWRGDVPEET